MGEPRKRRERLPTVDEVKSAVVGCTNLKELLVKLDNLPRASWYLMVSRNPELKTLFAAKEPKAYSDEEKKRVEHQLFLERSKRDSQRKRMRTLKLKAEQRLRDMNNGKLPGFRKMGNLTRWIVEFRIEDIRDTIAGIHDAIKGLPKDDPGESKLIGAIDKLRAAETLLKRFTESQPGTQGFLPLEKACTDNELSSRDSLIKRAYK